MAMALVIERADGGARLRGRLGFDGAAAATPRWRELIGAGAKQVDVDASGLERPDSATLAVLLAWAAHASAAGTQLRFRQMPEGLLALARLCGTERLLQA